MPTIAEREAAVCFNTGKRFPVTIVRGEGSRVWDDQGKPYLDFVAGIAVLALGHGHPAVVETLKIQAAQLIQVSNYFYSVPQIELAELLTQVSGLSRVFFCNSGAEANEGCIKLARKWGQTEKNGAFEIVAMEQSFHGRTLATVTATGTPRYSEPFQPLPDGFRHVPFNDMAALEAVVGDRTCAVMLEPVQGEGGVNVPDPDYLPAVRALCDERNVALIMDEVQTGFGRTGRLFGFQHSGVAPDIMAIAKGLGSGVPIGAFLANDRFSVFQPGDHGTTFGGQPLMTAVALSVVRTIIKEDLAAQAEAKGERVRAKLRALEDRHPQIVDVRGQGLLIGIEFDGEIAGAVVSACREQGLLCSNLKPTVIRWVPPLTVTETELDEAAAIFDAALSAVETAEHARPLSGTR